MEKLQKMFLAVSSVYHRNITGYNRQTAKSQSEQWDIFKPKAPQRPHSSHSSVCPQLLSHLRSVGESWQIFSVGECTNFSQIVPYSVWKEDVTLSFKPLQSTWELRMDTERQPALMKLFKHFEIILSEI